MINGMTFTVSGTKVVPPENPQCARNKDLKGVAQSEGFTGTRDRHLGGGDLRTSHPDRQTIDGTSTNRSGSAQ